MVNKMTGVSQRTVRRIFNEGNMIEYDKGFSTPGKKRPKINKKIVIDSFDRGVIRRIVHNFHETDGIWPTLKNVHHKLKAEINFMGSLSTTRNILRSLGFRWLKTQDNIAVLKEKPSVQSLRAQYIRNSYYNNTNSKVDYKKHLSD